MAKGQLFCGEKQPQVDKRVYNLFTTIHFLDLIPQKRDLLAKRELRLDEVRSMEVMMNIEVDAQRST